MAISKAQQKAVNRYMAANYDRVNLTVPKGKKDVIKAHSEARGESVNGFINRAVDETMGRDKETKTTHGVQNATEGESLPSVPLHLEAMKAAQKAAQIAGETVPQFIERAVQTQAQRDKTSLSLGINPATGGKIEKG